jgi:tetratricopeptide (TPR) repeat protein
VRRPVSTVVAVLLSVLLAGLGGCGTQGPKSSPSPAKDMLKRGDEHLKNGKKDKAIAAYGEAIKADPNAKDAYRKRAMLLNETGKPKEALKDYSKAIELDPNDSYSYEQRSLIYKTAMKDPAKAQADSDKAFALREKQREDARTTRNKAMEKKNGKK